MREFANCPARLIPADFTLTVRCLASHRHKSSIIITIECTLHASMPVAYITLYSLHTTFLFGFLTSKTTERQNETEYYN